MERPSTSYIDVEWVQRLEDYVAEVLSSRASRDVNALHQERTTFGQHAADVLAAAAGSWTFILLNLVLSCLAALQAPVIMMSQKRQATRDRLQAESDYQVNVKAEILLEHLTKEVEEIKWLLVPAADTGDSPDSARRG